MKIILIIVGTLSLALGVLGIFVPLLPTTPFLLLSASLFLRSSSRLHKWLIENPILGEYIRNYNENRAMPLRSKISSIVILWISILYSTFVFADGRILIQGVLIVIAIAVTWHILSLGTPPEE